MQSTLPPELQQAAGRYLTTEFVTIDAVGRPIVWPVTPYYRADEACEPTPRRYEREMADKLPALHALAPTGPLKRFFSWYYDRIYLSVRPERVYVWPSGELEAEPTLYDAHVEEVRSGHNEEPEEGHAPPEGGMDVWDPRLDRLGREDPTAVLAFVGPDGFPFAVRVPVRADEAAHVVRIEGDPVGAPIEAGPASLCAHAHADDLTWQRSYQVRGDLAEQNGLFVLHPHRVVAGL